MKLIDFKIKNRYVDLPDENYTPNPFTNVLLIYNKIVFAYSTSCLSWFFLLFLINSKMYALLSFYMILMFSLIVSYGVYYRVKKIESIDFTYLFLGFAIFGGFSWVIQIN